MKDRGAGNDGPRQYRSSVQFPERGWQDGRVTISERVEAARRERRVSAALGRAACGNAVSYDWSANESGDWGLKPTG
jgi:hypothetical protein